MTKQKPDISWEWLKHHLYIQGLTFSKLARIHNVDRSCFTAVKRRCIPKYEALLARYLDLDPWIIWPDRYDANNNPSRVSSRYQGHRYLDHDPQKVNKKRSRTND
jgi:lambda repressor-like predicted transcriptional regulator